MEVVCRALCLRIIRLSTDPWRLQQTVTRSDYSLNEVRAGGKSRIRFAGIVKKIEDQYGRVLDPNLQRGSQKIPRLN